MTKKEIHEKVLAAFDAKEPDVLSRLDFDSVEMLTRKPAIRKRYAGAAAVYAAACLAVLIALPFIIGGVSDSPVNPGIDPGADTTGEMPADLDFGGDEFRILCRGEAEDGRYDPADRFIWYEEVSAPYSAGILQEAVVARNEAVESDCNVKITVEAAADPTAEAVSRMKAGQCDYDAIADYGNVSAAAALEGYLYDYHSLENINLTKSYWMPWTVDDLTVADMMFVNGGYITMGPISGAEVIFFNEMVADSLAGFELPYGYVYDGTWTYDVYLDMIQAAGTNLNGDGTPLYYTAGIYGDEVLDGIMGLELMTVRNGDGSYSLNTVTDTMRVAYGKYIDAIDDIDDPVFESVEDDPWIDRIIYFNNESVLFYQDEYGAMYAIAPNRSSGRVGVVPMPVLNAGDSYVTMVDPASNMLSVPADVKDSAMVGAVLDRMAAESESTLVSVYDECTLKTQGFVDARDDEMLKLIRSSITYEWTELYIKGKDFGRAEAARTVFGGSDAAEYLKDMQNELDSVIAKLNAVKDENGYTGQTDPFDYEVIMPEITDIPEPIPPENELITLPSPGEEEPEIPDEIRELVDEANEKYRASGEWDGDESYLDPDAIKDFGFGQHSAGMKKKNEYGEGVIKIFDELVRERYPDAVRVSTAEGETLYLDDSVYYILEPEKAGFESDEDALGYLESVTYEVRWMDADEYMKRGFHPYHIQVVPNEPIEIRDIGCVIEITNTCIWWYDGATDSKKYIPEFESEQAANEMYGLISEKVKYDYLVKQIGKDGADKLMPQYVPPVFD